jgi:hypothetical protein
MPVKYKILGQVTPAPNTYVDMYAVPTANSAVISTLNIANLSTSNVSFRIALKQGGIPTANAWPTTKQFLSYEVPLPQSDSLGLTMGITLDATDVVTVFSFQGNVAFNLFGSEVY